MTGEKGGRGRSALPVLQEPAGGPGGAGLADPGRRDFLRSAAASAAVAALAGCATRGGASSATHFRELSPDELARRARGRSSGSNRRASARR